MFTTVESCMLFGPFDEKRVFGIENSELHQKAGRDDGVSAVEFLELDGDIAAISDKDMEYRFILVINGHKPDWLTPRRMARENCMNRLKNISNN